MVDDVIVVDDFLDKISFKKIKESLLLQDWYFNPDITFGYDQGDSKKHYGFYSMIVDEGSPDQYSNTPSSWLIFTLNEKIKSQFNFNTVERCRIDMTTYRGEDQVTFKRHIDMEGFHYTSIYYTNECNAPTIIYNEKSMSSPVDLSLNLTIKEKVYPKENRLVVFPGNYIHTGMCATDVPYRILINSNFT